MTRPLDNEPSRSAGELVQPTRRHVIDFMTTAEIVGYISIPGTERNFQPLDDSFKAVHGRMINVMTNVMIMMVMNGVTEVRGRDEVETFIEMTDPEYALVSDRLFGIWENKADGYSSGVGALRCGALLHQAHVDAGGEREVRWSGPTNEERGFKRLNPGSRSNPSK